MGVSTLNLCDEHKQRELFSPAREKQDAKPFLKWAGGKSSLLNVLRRCHPKKFDRYFEPFLGGGAFFFDLNPSSAVLSDSNPELIHCYQVVSENPDQVINFLGEMKVTEEEFYRIRAIVPETLSDVQRAARFIYLNKTCYNGLYRVNKKGLFNTPYGHSRKVSLVNRNNLRLASQALRRATIACDDYCAVLKGATSGDFVYFDPPYLPIGKYSDFKRYTKDYFYEADHVALSKVYRELSDRGCFLLLSNSYHERIASLYEGFQQVTVQAPRFVNCKGGGRGKVKELLISNYFLSVSA